MDYQDFLASKPFRHEPCGFDADLSSFECLFPFQRAIVERSLRRGKAAIFADTGLGKARMGLYQGIAQADRTALESDPPDLSHGTPY